MATKLATSRHFDVDSGLVVIGDPAERYQRGLKEQAGDLVDVRVKPGAYHVHFDRDGGMKVWNADISVTELEWHVLNHREPLKARGGQLVLADSAHYRNDRDSVHQKRADVRVEAKGDGWFAMVYAITTGKAQRGVIPGGVALKMADEYEIWLGHLPGDDDTVYGIEISPSEQDKESSEEGGEGEEERERSDAEVEAAELVVGRRQGVGGGVETRESGITGSEDREDDDEEGNDEAEEGEAVQDEDEESVPAQQEKDVKKDYTVREEGDEVVVTVPYYIERASTGELYSNGHVRREWQLFGSVRSGYRPPKGGGEVYIDANDDLDVLEFRFQGFDDAQPARLLDHVRRYIAEKEIGLPFGDQGDVLYLGVAPGRVGRLLVVYDD
jgi:hypothetical protein